MNGMMHETMVVEVRASVTVQVMLKLSDAAVDGAPGRRLDVYVDVSGGRVYPAALTPGASVRLTWLHVRQTGRTHRLYCASTPLTRVGVLAAAEEAAAPPAGGAQAAGPRVLLGHLMPNSLGADLWTCLVSVRYIHKVGLEIDSFGQSWGAIEPPRNPFGALLSWKSMAIR